MYIYLHKEDQSDMKRLKLVVCIVFIPTPLSLSLTANRGTTNCGVLTLTATFLSTMSHCLNLAPNRSAWVVLTPITRPATSLVPL